ncbi:MAG: NAD-binding protein, partial [archaeon]
VAILSKRVFPFIFRISAQSGELLYLTALATCFGFIALAYSLNISLAIGAFLAGLAISNLPYNAEAVSSIRGLRDFFVMLFFVSLGTQLTFNVGMIPVEFVVGALIILVILKPFVLYAVTQFAGYGSNTASKVSFGLLNMSEFSLILLFQGRTVGVLPENVYSFLVLLAAVSMVVTPYVSENVPGIQARLRDLYRLKIFSHFPLFSRKMEELQHVPDAHLNNHIIILGAGRSGKYLASGLSKNYPTVIVDHDPGVVAFFREKGMDAVYGNAHNPEILEKLHAERARLLVCALPDMDESSFILSFSKHHFPKLKVYLKANYYEDAWKLYKQGADYVVLTEIIGGRAFAESVDRFLRTGKVEKRIKMEEH